MLSNIAYNDTINISISSNNGHYHASNEYSMPGIKLIHF